MTSTSCRPTNFNPRTPCGVRQLCCQPQIRPLPISIHAPLAGCDTTAENRGIFGSISIHAPLAGCDHDHHHRQQLIQRFQSTHPLRGATSPARRCGARQRDFNPRTPCGVRRGPDGWVHKAENISIHAPLAGCDARDSAPNHATAAFQSTHPLRGATFFSALSTPILLFQSTHPLRGATRHTFSLLHPEDLFQSTHPLRGATARYPRHYAAYQISIHAPLAGCDDRCQAQ